MQLVAPVVVHVMLPGDEVTLYPVMADPPLEADAVHDTTELALALDVAVTPVGAAASVAGVTLLEAADATPVPAALVAVTVKVYDEPAVRPLVTVQLVAVATDAVQVPPPVLAVTVYPLMATPPLEAGSVQLTVASGGLL